MRPGVRQEGWLRWSAHPLGGVELRGPAQDSAFARGSSEVTVGLFGLIFCPEFAATGHACSYF